MIYKIKPNISIKKTLELVKKSRHKCIVIEDYKKNFLGIVTDGDIRRAINNESKLSDKINKIINYKPFYIKNNKKFNQKKNLNFNLVPILNKNHKFIKFIYINKKNLKKKKNLFFKTPIVIMAGGKGKRLQPFTNYIPKPLVPLSKKTIIENIYDSFFRLGFGRYYLIINYMHNYIKKTILEKKIKNIKFITEKKPLGTASSLESFVNKHYENIVVTNCDVLFNFDFRKALKFHVKNKSLLTVISSKIETIFNYGVFNLNNKNITGFEEKPRVSKIVNTGLYIINREILKFIPREKKFHMTDLIKLVIKKKKKILNFEISADNWLDFGNWDNFLLNEKKFNSKKWQKKFL